MRVGSVHHDSYTGATLRILETAQTSGGAVTVFELRAPEGWSAGPLHVHPHQVEAMTVLEGALELSCSGHRSVLGVRGHGEVSKGAVHTARNVGAGPLLMRVEFRPALRTADLFVKMFGGAGRRPPKLVPAALRGLVESIGYRDEIRYLWPGAVVGALAGLAAAAAVVRGQLRP